MEDFPWVSIIGGLMSTVVGAVATLAAVWSRLKKVDGDEKQRQLKSNMDVHTQVINEYQSIIQGFHQAVDELRAEHAKCMQQNQELQEKNSTLNRRVGELEVEVRELKRLINGK